MKRADPSDLGPEYRRLLWIASRFASSKEDAEDAVQEAWLEWVSQPDGSVRNRRAWMRLAVIHAASRIRTRETRRLERERRVSRERLEPSALDRVIARGECTRMLRMLRDVGDPYRTVLVLVFCKGLSYDEVSRQLQRRHSTIRSQVKRGLDQLRVRMQHRRP